MLSLFAPWLASTLELIALSGPKDQTITGKLASKTVVVPFGTTRVINPLAHPTIQMVTYKIRRGLFRHVCITVMM